MTWRTGTKNPHTLYLDEGGVSIPQGFIMNPGAAKRIVAAMNAAEASPPEPPLPARPEALNVAAVIVLVVLSVVLGAWALAPWLSEAVGAWL